MSDFPSSAPQRVADESSLQPSKSRKGLYPKVTVRLNGDLGEAIEELQEITHASTPSDVVKRALIIYHTLVKQKVAGNEPIIEKKEGDSIKRVPIFL